MLIIPSGVKIHLALGHTDMRKGFDSLAVLVQAQLKKDPSVICSSSAAGRRTRSRSCFGTETGCACSPCSRRSRPDRDVRALTGGL
jgi:transposase